jgi:hypothetical protein
VHLRKINSLVKQLLVHKRLPSVAMNFNIYKIMWMIT